MNSLPALTTKVLPSLSLKKMWPSLATGAKNPANPFARDVVKGSERVLCLNEKDGAIVWKHEYECAYDISYPGVVVTCRAERS